MTVYEFEDWNYCARTKCCNCIVAVHAVRKDGRRDKVLTEELGGWIQDGLIVETCTREETKTMRRCTCKMGEIKTPTAGGER